jgi:hypothetical protein
MGEPRLQSLRDDRLTQTGQLIVTIGRVSQPAVITGRVSQLAVIAAQVGLPGTRIAITGVLITGIAITRVVIGRVVMGGIIPAGGPASRRTAGTAPPARPP